MRIYGIFVACLMLACVRPPTERRGGTTAGGTPWHDAVPIPVFDRLATHFAVIGDFGMAGPDEASVAALVKSFVPDFVITVGDNNYPLGADDTIDQNIGQYYHQFIGGYHGNYGAGAPVNRFFPSLGNHDWMTAGAVPYLGYFQLPGNERYYDAVEGDVELFALDSDPSEPDGVDAGSIQAVWLQGALAASSSPWRIVYMHHPPYSSGPHGSATYMQWPFKEWGVNLVLSGHDHLYEHLEEGGLVYLINGLGGAETYAFVSPVPGSLVRFTGGFGALLIDADPTMLRTRFYDVEGHLIDETIQSAAAGAEP